MVVAPPAGQPYHRLTRTWRHRWWRPPVGLLVLLAVWSLAVLLLTGAALGVAAATGAPPDAHGQPRLAPLGELTLGLLTIGVMLPCVALAVRWVQRRPVGSLSSVTGRLRGGWLLLCLLPAGAATACIVVAGLVLLPTSAEAPSWIGWPAFLAGVVALLALVPLQAAAEEYLCRGYLLQGVGAFLRRPWVPIAVQALVFAALHGWGGLPGFVDLLVFGAVAGYLTVRTGGLEAAIALHVVNNLVAVVGGLALGQLPLDESAADLPWQMLAVDVPVFLAYAAVVVRLADRRSVARLVPAPVEGPVPVVGVRTS